MIPTGAAYRYQGWAPSQWEIVEFLQAARDLNLSGANFWEWGHTRTRLPELWDAVSAFNWNEDPEKEIVDRYFSMLNDHKPAQMLQLYHPHAVHMIAGHLTSTRPGLLGWYERFFNQLLPGAAFTVGARSNRPGTCGFTWTATSDSGVVMDGSDAFGIRGGKISYHFTNFSIKI
jgi:hypothetical protein